MSGNLDNRIFKGVHLHDTWFVLNPYGMMIRQQGNLGARPSHSSLAPYMEVHG